MASIIRVDSIRDSGDNVIVSSNGSGTFTNNLGIDNTPSWMAQANSAQSVSANTNTKINFGNEIYDTNNAFSDSRFTCPSGGDGKYFVSAQTGLANLPANKYNQVRLYKNGSNIGEALGLVNFANGTDGLVLINFNITLVAGDYLEIFGRHDNSSSLNTRQSNDVFFTGYKIIGA